MNICIVILLLNHFKILLVHWLLFV